MKIKILNQGLLIAGLVLAMFSYKLINDGKYDAGIAGIGVSVAALTAKREDNKPEDNSESEIFQIELRHKEELSHLELECQKNLNDLHLKYQEKLHRIELNFQKKIHSMSLELQKIKLETNSLTSETNLEALPTSNDPIINFETKLVENIEERRDNEDVM